MNKRTSTTCLTMCFICGLLYTAAVAAASGPQLKAFIIVDADTDVSVGRLLFDDLIDLDHSPESLNIVVQGVNEDVDPIGSVVFTLDGVPVKTENHPPYAIGGDNGGDYLAYDLPIGFHIIEANAYSGPDGTGDKGPSSIVSFEVGRSDFDIDTHKDSADANPGDGICGDSREHCSLRAAIEEANALEGRQWVHAPAGNYLLNLGPIIITDRVTLRGESTSDVVIDGNGDRAFIVESLRSDLDNLTITGSHGDWGAGGIYVMPGSELKLLDADISGNTANGGPGAGLGNWGTTTIRRSRFTDNAAGETGICGGGVTATGGALFNGASGTLRIYRSLILDNFAMRGGGLVNEGLATASNTTFSGNRVVGGGGAIYNKATGRLHLAYSTLTENEANGRCPSGEQSSEAENRSVGGGIYNLGSITVGSSIIAQNLDNRGSFDPLYSPDCATDSPSGIPGKLTSAGRNVWGELNFNCNLVYPNGLAYYDCKPAQAGFANCVLFNDIPILRDKWGVPGDVLDAELLPLAGYPIEVHGISDTSPARDFGGSLPLEFIFLSCPVSDQVHGHRPAEGYGVCDAGAYERSNRQ